jgi:hypothetical protein
MKKFLAALLAAALIITAAPFVFADDAEADVAVAAEEAEDAIEDEDIDEEDEAALAGEDYGIITLGDIYAVAAVNVSVYANAYEECLADPIAYAEKAGLITTNDMIRYKLETGYAFDYATPVTRQEYAFIINRMFHILKRFGVEIRQDTSTQSLGSRVENSGIGRVESFSQVTSDKGIGSTLTRTNAFVDTVEAIGIGGVAGNREAGDANRTLFNADSGEIRGSVRGAFFNMINLGILSPKTFEEKQIFFVEDPKAKDEDKVKTAEEFEAKNEAARDRFIAYIELRNQQIILNDNVFLAPNDFLTMEELLVLDEINEAILTVSMYTVKQILAGIEEE